MKRLLSLSLLLLAVCRLGAAEPVFSLDFNNDFQPQRPPGATVEEHGPLLTPHGEGQAAHFDGRAALAITLPEAGSLSFGGPGAAMTIELKLQLHGPVRPGLLLAKGANYRLLLTQGGKLALSFYAQGAWRVTEANEATLAPDQWYHVIVQIDGQRVAFIIDDKLVELHELESAMVADRGSLLLIGGTINAEGSVRGAAFLLDEVRLYAEPLYPEAFDATPGQSILP